MGHMAWWVIALVVWVVASFAAAGVVVLLARRGRRSEHRTTATARRRGRLRAPGTGRAAASAGPTGRYQGPRGRQVTTAARRHRRR
jgi:hypothetical protein